MCTCLHLYIYIYIYIHIYTHAYTYTHMHVYTHTYMYVYIYTHIHIYVYTCIHVYMYTYVYIHTIHIHGSRGSGSRGGSPCFRKTLRSIGFLLLLSHVFFLLFPEYYSVKCMPHACAPCFLYLPESSAKFKTISLHDKQLYFRKVHADCALHNIVLLLESVADF